MVVSLAFSIYGHCAHGLLPEKLQFHKEVLGELKILNTASCIYLVHTIHFHF